MRVPGGVPEDALLMMFLPVGQCRLSQLWRVRTHSLWVEEQLE